MNPVSILIVDDSSSDRYLLTRDLQRIGLGDHIVEAADGVEAFEFLTAYEENRAESEGRTAPLLIFLDINMPRMNGLEFLERFAELRERRDDYTNVMVLMVSSSEHPDEQQIALHREFVSGFIVKGAKPEDLREKVRRALAE